MKYTGRLVLCFMALVCYLPWIIYRFYIGSLGFSLAAGLIIMLLLCWFLGSRYDRVKYFSLKDFLSGAYNRQFVYETFPKLSSQIDRKKENLSVTIIDIDDFKKVNDNFGHKKGDLAIQNLSLFLINNVRTGDIVARWGGDEFIIITPFTDKYLINQVIRRLERNLSQLGRDIKFSHGSATYPTDSREFDELVRIADERMYQNKMTKKLMDTQQICSER